MNPKKPILLLLVVAFWLTAVHAQEAECFRWDATINGKPVRFLLDTGCSEPGILFQPAVARLGLKVQAQQSGEFNGRQVPFQLTEGCALELPDWGFRSIFHVRASWRVRTPLLFFDDPGPPVRYQIDGVLGWPAFRHGIVQMDASRRQFKFLSAVPKSAKGWTKLPIRSHAEQDGVIVWISHSPLIKKIVTRSGLLELDLPSPNGSSNPVVLIDTGDLGGMGVHLSPQAWGAWKSTQTNPLTVLNGFSGALGDVAVEEVGWANELSLGPLKLTDVRVAEAGFSTRYVAALDFAALKRLDLIVDGRRGFAYLRPKTTPAPPSAPEGPTALFAPASMQSSNLVAHVLDRSAAFAAGIRNGDTLVKIDGREVAQWRTRPGEKWRPKSAQSHLLVAATNDAAGIKLELTLKRGEQTFDTIVAQPGLAVFAPPLTTNPSPRSKNLSR